MKKTIILVCIFLGCIFFKTTAISASKNKANKADSIDWPMAVQQAELLALESPLETMQKIFEGELNGYDFQHQLYKHTSIGAHCFYKLGITNKENKVYLTLHVPESYKKKDKAIELATAYLKERTNLHTSSYALEVISEIIKTRANSANNIKEYDKTRDASSLFIRTRLRVCCGRWSSSLDIFH